MYILYIYIYDRAPLCCANVAQNGVGGKHGVPAIVEKNRKLPLKIL